MGEGPDLKWLTVLLGKYNLQKTIRQLGNNNEESLRQGTKSTLSMFMTLAINTLILQEREKLLELSGKGPGFQS